MRRPARAVAVWLCLLAPVRAQNADPHDVAYDLAAIEAEHALCNFPLTEEQQDLILQRREALVTGGTLSADEIGSVRDQVAAALERQKGEGLCRPDGAEARLYGKHLTSLGLL